MEISEKNLLLAFRLAGGNFLNLKNILDCYENLIDAFNDNFSQITNKITIKKISNINIYVNQEILNQRFISIFDFAYPSKLKELKNPPLILWYEGNIDLVSKPSIAIVGSRNISSFANHIIIQVVPELINNDICIVSGLAFGVDASAHKQTIENNGLTIGVLGGGLDYKSFSPKSNWALYQDIILKNGLVITEYPAGFKPTVYTYPERNRIVAGLAEKILVVQASEKSGSLITAEVAKKLNRKVFTPTVDYFEPIFKGNRDLIENGASVMTKPSDLIDDKLVSSVKVRKPETLLEFNFEELLEYFDIKNDNDAFSRITQLELNGQIKSVESSKWLVL
jgi:DNA processing protein